MATGQRAHPIIVSDVYLSWWREVDRWDPPLVPLGLGQVICAHEIAVSERAAAAGAVVALATALATALGVLGRAARTLPKDAHSLAAPKGEHSGDGVVSGARAARAHVAQVPRTPAKTSV